MIPLFLWLNHNLGAALVINGKIHQRIRSLGRDTVLHDAGPEWQSVTTERSAGGKPTVSWTRWKKVPEEPRLETFFSGLRSNGNDHLHVWHSVPAFIWYDAGTTP